MTVDIQKLEQHVATRSYIEGYTPSQADVSVYKLVGVAPDASKYPNVSRWFTHIKSYSSEHQSFPGNSTASDAFASSGSTPADADEEEIDLFGSDEEDDAEAERIKAERVAAYNEKKAAKPKTLAKSMVTLDVKPWDDSTDMKALEESVRSIEKDGLVWGQGKLVAVGFGIKKLQINVVVEDDKVSVDDIQENIQAFEDYVQSVDVAAFMKL